ncbi:MAG: hypothetical protein CM1200mP3_10760 [Chloroflexota bacterium]|nr:MAG: hypothetical protein CM1200mP3_10760 [Chloroflexota bacterium]
MKAATLRDNGLPFATEASWLTVLFKSGHGIAYKAVQIHGGTGYFAPTPVERIFRDARVTEIYEGTSEVQRLVIARNLLRG